MKNRLKMVIVFGILILGMSGCAKQKEAEKEEAKTENTDTDQNSSELEETKLEESSEKEVKIYFSNEDASGFDTENIVMSEVSTTAIWDKLVEKGVVPMDVKVLSCKETKQDGEKALELNLSEKFSTYLNGLGTSGEYITIGSICNTFLDAFDGKTIRITVEGKKLETGHAEYPGYMSKYEPQ